MELSLFHFKGLRVIIYKENDAFLSLRNLFFILAVCQSICYLVSRMKGL